MTIHSLRSFVNETLLSEVAVSAQQAAVQGLALHLKKDPTKNVCAELYDPECMSRVVTMICKTWEKEWEEKKTKYERDGYEKNYRGGYDSWNYSHASLINQSKVMECFYGMIYTEADIMGPYDPSVNYLTCERDVSSVKYSRARKGYGPLMYDIAMAESNKGLKSHGDEVSQSACSVWKKYSERPDVKATKLSTNIGRMHKTYPYLGHSYNLSQPQNISKLVQTHKDTMTELSNTLNIDVKDIEAFIHDNARKWFDARGRF